MTGSSFRRARYVMATMLATLGAGGCASKYHTHSLQVLPADTRVLVELPGPRTTVFGRHRQKVIGQLVASEAEVVALRVRATDPTIAIPLASVSAMYASDGPRSKFQAATLGGVRGGAIGLVSGAIMAAFVSSTDESASRVIVGRAVGGATLGVVIGYLVPGERWRRIPLGLPPR